MSSINTTSQAARTPLQPLSRIPRATNADAPSEVDIQKTLGEERARQAETRVTVSREAAAALKQQQQTQREEATLDKALQERLLQQRATREQAEQTAQVTQTAPTPKESPAESPQPAASQRENTRKAVESMYRSSDATSQGRLKAVFA